MKIIELLESVEGEIPKRHQNSTKGLHVFKDGEKWNSDYTHYRVMMAAACTDGKKDVDMDTKSWIGKYKSSHPYSQADQEKLKKAYKAAGANYKDLNHNDLTSQELDSTNTVSPVAKIKKNKYGV